MKKLLLLLTLLFSIQCITAQYTWTQKMDFGGTGRVSTVSFSIGTKGYIGTGLDNTSNRKKDFWEYDPSANTWTQKADFGGTERVVAVGFSIGTKGYIGTGFDGSNFFKDFWEYDPSVNTWKQKADFGGTARYYAVGFSIGTKGYIGTGADDNGPEKDFWEYDPSADTWTQKTDFGGSARAQAVGFSIGTKGYIGTGGDNSGNKKDFWEYDPTADTWTQKTDFGGTARVLAVGFSIGTKGYIGTGGDNSGLKKDFWEYDPSADTWTQKTDFGGTARYSAAGFSIGTKGYIGTGADVSGINGTKDFWEYGPVVFLPTTTTVSSNPAPSFTSPPNNSVTFTATVTSNGSPVSTGTVTFTSNGSTIPGGGAVAVSGGQATLSTAFSAEGTYNIVATYNATGLYASSFGSVTQTVNNHTTVSSNQYCNTGLVTVGVGTNVVPYPSEIFVSGISGNISSLTVNLNGIATKDPSHLDLLLVSPGGQNFILLNAVSHVGIAAADLTLDDAAGSQLPESPSDLVSGTYRPTSYAVSPTLPAPAPPGPYNSPAPTGTATLTSIFGDTNPNGTWKLFATNNDGLKTTDIEGGWCLNITAVLPGPTASVLNLDGASSVCSGFSTKIGVAITGGTSPYTVVYTDGTQNYTVNNYTSGTDITVSPTANPTTYSLVSVTDADGNAGTGNGGTAVVTVNPVPTATIGATGTPACQDGTSPVITFTGSGGTAPYTFSYAIGSGDPQTITDDGSGSVTLPAPTTTPGTVTYNLLSVQDASSTHCGQTLSGLSASVTVNARPTASISGSGMYCSGASTTTNLTINVTGTGPFTGTLSDNTPFGGAGPTIPVSVSPTSTTTYTIITLSDANCTAQPSDLSGSATVTVNPAPNVVITNPAPVCSPATADLTAATVTNGSDAGLNYTYWTDAAATLSYATPTTAGAGTWYIKGTNPATGCSAIQAVTVTINPVPIATIATAPVVTSGSSGNTASTVSGGTTYVWSITNGKITAGGSTNMITYTAGASGSVILAVTVTNSFPCSASSGDKPVTISTTGCPNATIASQLSVCSNSAVNIASVASAGTGATYAWSITNGTITAGSNTSCIIYAAKSSGTVTLGVTVTNKSGCKVSSTGKLITINALPNATITVGSPVCGNSIGNIASVPAASNGACYSWSIINGTITAGKSGNKINYTAGASGSVTLAATITNSSCCKASSGDKLVTIIAAPNPAITASSSVCAGSTGNMASVTSAGAGSVYAWTIGGGMITSGSGTNNIKYMAGASGYVTLGITVTNSNGCKAPGNKKITIITAPVATITASSPVCAASTGNAASVSSGGTGAGYAWTIHNGTITSGGTTNSIKYMAGSSGTVTLNLTVTNSTGCKAIGSKNVTTTSKVVPAFTQIGPLCRNSTAPSLPTRSTNSITGTWSPNKISTSSLTTTTYTFTPSAGQCASTATMKITVKSCTTLSSDDIVSGKQTISKAIPLMDAVILPNPSENFFTLIIKGNRKEVAEIRVFDVLGRRLEQFRISTGSSVQFGGNYAHGTYIVQVLQGPDRKVLKAIKE